MWLDPPPWAPHRAPWPPELRCCLNAPLQTRTQAPIVSLTVTAIAALANAAGADFCLLCWQANMFTEFGDGQSATYLLGIFVRLGDAITYIFIAYFCTLVMRCAHFDGAGALQTRASCAQRHSCLAVPCKAHAPSL